MKNNNKTKVIKAFGILCFVMVFFITNHYIYWNGLTILINVTYIALGIFLLYLLSKIVSHYSGQSDFVKKYHNIIFLVISVLAVVGYGEMTLSIIDTYVIPKPVNCSFVDKHGYYLEETFGWNGGCNLEIIAYNEDSEGNLEYLELFYQDEDPIDNVRITRQYEDGRLITSRYEKPRNEIALNSLYDISVSFDWEIEPDYTNNLIFEYEYIYGVNEFTLLRKEIYTYDNEVWRTYFAGSHYVFDQGKITAYRLTGNQYNDIYNITEENYKDIVISKITTHIDNQHYDSELTTEFLLNLETHVEERLNIKASFIDSITSDDEYQNVTVDGLNESFEYVLFELEQELDESSEHYLEYRITDEAMYKSPYYVDTYINSLLFPMSFSSDLDFHPNYQYTDNYLTSYSITNKVRDTFDWELTRFTSEFKHHYNKEELEYIDEYINGELLQRIRIVDLDVLMRIETFSYKGYNIGFNKQIPNLGGPRTNHYILNTVGDRVSFPFRDYVSNRRRVMIIKPVDIVEVVTSN